MNKNKKIIGLIGGMGPFASMELCRLLLAKSSSDFGAKSADDFPEIVLDSAPIPDFISTTKNLSIATKMLVSRIKKLNDFGCTTIAMVCNTGHILFPILSKISKVKMLSLIDVIRDRVLSLKFKRVGLLATPTTFKSKIFNKAFSNTNIEIIKPDKKTLDLSEKVIIEAIANKINQQSVRGLLRQAKNFIKNENLDGIILGCTELPLVIPRDSLPNTIDCLDVLSDQLLSDFFESKHE